MTLCVLLESLNWFDVSYGVICRSSCTSRLSPLYSNQQTSVVLDRRSATGQKRTSCSLRQTSRNFPSVLKEKLRDGAERAVL